LDEDLVYNISESGTSC